MICTSTCHGALRDTAIVSVKCEAKSDPTEATGYNTIVKMGAPHSLHSFVVHKQYHRLSDFWNHIYVQNSIGTFIHHHGFCLLGTAPSFKKDLQDQEHEHRSLQGAEATAWLRVGAVHRGQRVCVLRERTACVRRGLRCQHALSRATRRNEEERRRCSCN